MYNKELNEKLSEIRGIILSDSVVVESALTWNLRGYFFPKTTKQASDFYYYILNTPYFTFDKKISLYEQIPYFQKLRRYSKVKEALRYIQKIRNALAHWTLDEERSKEKEIILYTYFPFKEMTITAKSLERFKEYEKYLLKIFGWRQTLRDKYNIQ